MERAYLDTSAYVKRFCPEVGSETVTRLFDACEADKVILVTSQWTLSESVAAIDRKHRRGEISSNERAIAVTALLNKSMELARKGSLVLVPIRSEFVPSSWPLIVDKHISADDALQLLSALVTLCNIFVAADDYLVTVAREEGFDGYNVEDEEDRGRLIKRLKL